MKTIICEIIVRFTLETVENVLFIRTSFMKIQQESRPGEYFKESMFLYECIGYS
jgi:hypothetical protein